jgi:DNA-binding MarR family transcriptional regulator
MMSIDEPIQTTSKSEFLTSDGDRKFRRMVHDLLAFSARLEEVRSRFGAYVGLSGIQYTVLISVHHHTGTDGIGIKAIADHLALSGAFVTVETNKLVKLGLLEKRPNPMDRRRVQLTVTPRGSALLKELAPVQCEVNDALFDSLDARGFARLATMASDLKADADRALLLIDYLTGKSGAR